MLLMRVFVAAPVYCEMVLSKDDSATTPHDGLQLMGGISVYPVY